MMIELLVAMALIAGGLAALMGVFSSSEKLSTNSEKLMAASHVSQRELEAILALRYDQIGLTSIPSGSASRTNPNFYVVSDAATCAAATPAATSAPCFRWDRSNTSQMENFCATSSTLPCSTGTVDPGPTSWGSGRLTGSIYRYVTWVRDSCPTCNGSTDMKRVTIAVTVDGPNAPKVPIINSTIVTNPSAGPGAG